MGYFNLPTQNSTPSQLAFTRNPVIVKDGGEVKEQPATGYPFTVEMDGLEVFSGRFNYPYSVDLADIVDAYVRPLPEPGDVEPANYGPILVIEDFNEFNLRAVFASFRGLTAKNFAFLALPGGVSRQNLRKYGGSSDVFTSRLLAENANFFMTTRTSGWRVVVKETELYPLYFLVGQDDLHIKFTEPAMGRSLDVELPEGGAYALDIDALRRHFFDVHGVLASVFDVHRNGKYACNLVISQAKEARSRHRLKFRNSFGVFEIFEISGELSMAPEWDCQTYRKYDPATHYYTTRRARSSRTQRVRFDTGIMKPGELSFLMDMLGSDEVYLLDVPGAPVRVIPSADDFSYMARPEVPESFTVGLEVADAEANILPDIDDNTSASRPRIFSDEFSNQFN